MRVAWVIVLLEEVDAWYRELCDQDEETAALVAAAINLLEEDGPNLARPLADRIEGSKLHNLKELRPGSTGTSEVRILFIFDPQRQASYWWQAIRAINGPSGTRRAFRSLKRDTSGGWPASTTTRLESRTMAKATKWEDVKADLRAKGRFDDEKVQANMERLRSEIRMHRPTEIREALGITQQFLAEQIGISQSRVSQIERGELEHTEVATLRSYFRELGGEVEVVVRLGDERLQIA
jgi:predicted XRE-type DNA-binding protein